MSTLRALQFTIAVVIGPLLCGLAQAVNCKGDPNPMTCAAYQSKAETIQRLATSDRTKWEQVPIQFTENGPTPYIFLPDGTVLEMSTGHLRRPPNTKPNPQVAKLVENRRNYIDALFQFHTRGILTYDMYPCDHTCDGHREGFKWAESNQIKDYSSCAGNSKSFVEGCIVQVKRLKNILLRDEAEEDEAASELNPSIKKRSPGKPGAASQVKRHPAEKAQ